jgi:hypothetical protein
MANLIAPAFLPLIKISDLAPPSMEWLIVSGPSGYIGGGRTHQKFLTLSCLHLDFKMAGGWIDVTGDALMERGWVPEYWCHLPKGLLP